MPDHNLRVLLIDEDERRARDLSRSLTETGDTLAGAFASRSDLLAQARELDPDVIIINLESPDRDTLESLRQLHEERPRPIVMFVDRTEEALTQQAIEAGVSAYVVAGFNPTRVNSILDVAVARFRTYHTLPHELRKSRETLAERKLIERAK